MPPGGAAVPAAAAAPTGPRLSPVLEAAIGDGGPRSPASPAAVPGVTSVAPSSPLSVEHRLSPSVALEAASAIAGSAAAGTFSPPRALPSMQLPPALQSLPPPSPAALPRYTWRQTASAVSVIVEVADIDANRVRAEFSARRAAVSFVASDTRYELSLALCGDVVPASSFARAASLNLVLVLRKASRGEWRQLERPDDE